MLSVLPVAWLFVYILCTCRHAMVYGETWLLCAPVNILGVCQLEADWIWHVGIPGRGWLGQFWYEGIPSRCWLDPSWTCLVFQSEADWAMHKCLCMCFVLWWYFGELTKLGLIVIVFCFGYFGWPRKGKCMTVHILLFIGFYDFGILVYYISILKQMVL